MDVEEKKSGKNRNLFQILFFFLIISVWIFEWYNKPEPYLYRLSPDSIQILIDNKNDEYKVIIEGENNQHPVLGEYKKSGDYIEFIPTFPFTAEQVYEVTKNGEDYFSFLPMQSTQTVDYKSTELLKIYPEVDTVPENLLKMYFTFSHSIDASQNILDHIVVYDTETKETRDIFLRLENELWNKDRTEVTLWLDPGRIKKDLIPNKEHGSPLIKWRTYEIVVVENLRDINGKRIIGKRKEFTVGNRDESKPNIQKWEITKPARDTKESIGFMFHESLDMKLFIETVRVYDSNSKVIKGEFFLSKNAKSALFIPENFWAEGKYTIEVESRLEDLAGNNLNRLFDTDLQSGEVVDYSKTKKISFTIQ
ncbi:hypothetical protein AAON49_07495 [Pseudotenacibaculum sp. MALMAid0570]|uniref:hypothetical protein n=1 Tax=Pseudotenacibaculum sp. MALMAid0570 TaxID=3143938 RepID=UPI0032E004BE